jgi:hypothetical protein
MKRLRFMQEESGAKLVPLRTEVYMLPPKFKLDKDRRRVVDMTFSIKMDAKLAASCDPKIAIGWEDCETLEREIFRVDSGIEVEHTTVDFYELRESAKPVFRVKNVIVAALLYKRDKGQTYLYFILSAFVSHHAGIERFLAMHYGSGLFCDFIEHISEPSPDQMGGASAQSLAEAIAAELPPGGSITSVQVESDGEKSTRVSPKGKRADK